MAVEFADACDCARPVVWLDNGEAAAEARCRKCGHRPRAVPPPQTHVPGEELLAILRGRVEEIRASDDGDSAVMGTPSASVLDTGVRDLIETVARLWLSEERPRKQRKRPLREWNSVRETAAYLGVSERWVYRHGKDKIGGWRKLADTQQAPLQFSREAILGYEKRMARP